MTVAVTAKIATTQMSHRMRVLVENHTPNNNSWLIIIITTLRLSLSHRVGFQVVSNSSTTIIREQEQAIIRPTVQECPVCTKAVVA